MKTFKESIDEDSYITVYHGTSAKSVEGIKKEGLHVTNPSPKWFMVSTDFESALFHATPAENENAIVIEFRIPVKNKPWLGYPYLWKPEKRSRHSTWFAIKTPLDPKFIKKIHEVPYKKFLEQKDKGF